MEIPNPSERTDDDSETELLPVVHDASVPAQEAAIIKSLLLLAPPPSSRESKRLLNGINSCSIRQTYAKILKVSKATNRELVHYLGVMLRYPQKDIDLDDLVDMKFTAQEKHLGQLLFIYFSIVEHYYGEMSYEQRLKVLFRYIFLFSSHMPLDLPIYRFFANILRSGFLDLFICRRFFVNFPFIKEFILDFSQDAPDKMIRIGYELPAYRLLVYTCCVATTSPISWVVRRWNIPMDQPIPSLFYRYDCTLFLEPIAIEKFQGLDDPLMSIRRDLKNSTSCPVCGMSGESEGKIQKHFEMVREIEAAVQEFNKSAVLQHPLSIEIIRLLPSVDIKSLGTFLCKQKNLPCLVKFAQTFDFREMNILEALRTFLSSFVMGGESQVIDRVIMVYANEFVRQNLTARDEEKIEEKIAKYEDMCRKISYGFIVLNTMMFNPTVEKRLSFEEFLKQLGYNDVEFVNDDNPSLSFDIEDLRGFYSSIQDNEMKTPSMWADGYDKFLLFKRLLKENFAVCHGLDGSGETCNSCVIACYRHIFRDSWRSFTSHSPETYFQISQLLDCRPEFEKYMDFHKKDVSRFLEAAKLYLENFEADSEFGSTLLDVVERTEKPKTSMLPDIKSMFSKASMSDIKDKPIPAIVQFAPSVAGLCSTAFANETICNRNCELLSQLVGVRRGYTRRICQRIILNNAHMITGFASYSEDLQLRILTETLGESLESVSDGVKVKFLLQEFGKGNITDTYRRVFNEIGVHDQESFDVFCMLLTKFDDDFDKLVSIERTVDESGKEKFRYKETCPEVLSHTANVLKLFASTNSVLNVRIAKKIHKDSCPVGDPKFNDFDKLAYMLLKCDGKERSLAEYASCIINYLSDSLVLLVALYERILPVLLQVSPELSGILIKILCRRIRTFGETGVACCAETKDPNTIFKIKHLVGILQQHSLVSETDIKAFGSASKPDVVEL